MLKSVFSSLLRRLRVNQVLPLRRDSWTPDRLKQLHLIEERIGYRFSDLQLLDRAFTHRSFVHERSAMGLDPGLTYESLEFLGDAVLGFLIAEVLFRTFPELDEGQCTKIRGHLVSTGHLAALSRSLDLGEFIRFSRGEAKTGGGLKPAILADVFESLVAAVYLDGGLDEARRFVTGKFDRRFSEIRQGRLQFLDSKSRLQEELHRLGLSAPSYQLVGESGPDHHKEFQVAVVVAGEEMAQGTGKSKKQAEQQAAALAIKRLDVLSQKEPVNQ